MSRIKVGECELYQSWRISTMSPATWSSAIGLRRRFWELFETWTTKKASKPHGGTRQQSNDWITQWYQTDFMSWGYQNNCRFHFVFVFSHHFENFIKAGHLVIWLTELFSKLVGSWRASGMKTPIIMSCFIFVLMSLELELQSHMPGLSCLESWHKMILNSKLLERWFCPLENPGPPKAYLASPTLSHDWLVLTVRNENPQKLELVWKLGTQGPNCCESLSNDKWDPKKIDNVRGLYSLES